MLLQKFNLGRWINSLFKRKAYLDWVTAPEFRLVLARDMEEAEACFQNQAFTSCHAILGSITELLIFYGLKRAYIPIPKNASLEKMIVLAKDNQLLPPGETYIGHAIRDFRNLLHPLKRVEEGRILTRETAEVAMQAAKFIMKEIKKQVEDYIPLHMEAFVSYNDLKVPICKMPFTIGRGENNSLTIDNPNISKNHCRIVFNKRSNLLNLIDLGSTNGTFIDQKKLRAQKQYTIFATVCFCLGKNVKDPKLTLWVEGEDNLTERE